MEKVMKEKGKTAKDVNEEEEYTISRRYTE
jgi:hypothetical protein